MQFYHGSKSGDVKELVTSHSKDGYVYATSSRLVALTYAARSYPKVFSSNGEQECFLELKPNLFELMTKGKSAYIYTLEDKNFEPVPQNNKCGHRHCFRAKENVKIINKEYISDVYQELLKYKKKGGFHVVKYETIPTQKRNALTKGINDCMKHLTAEQVNNPENFWKMFIE